MATNIYQPLGEDAWADFYGKTFASIVEAKEAVVAHARLMDSVELFIARSKKDKNAVLYKIWLRCKHGRKHEPRSRGVRISSTLKTDCPVYFTLTFRQEQQNCLVKVGCSQHNHSRFELRTYAAARKANVDTDIIHDLFAAGTRSKAIATAVRHAKQTTVDPTSDAHCHKMDLHNMKYKRARLELQGRTPIEALLDILAEKNIIHAYKKDAVTHKLSHLFFISPAATEIANLSPFNIILIDATYKTNRYQLPLVHGISMTSTANTYSLFFAFIAKEEVADYSWCMDQVRHYFPTTSRPGFVFVTDRELALINALATSLPACRHILCVWHINKNVTAKFKKDFGLHGEGLAVVEGLWNALIYAKSTTDYNLALQQFESHTSSTPEIRDYIESTWLRWKDRFVPAFMHGVRHYGNLTTSRVESAHAQAKSWIHNNRGCLKTVYDAISLSVDTQLHTFKDNLAHNKAKICLATPLWTNVNGKISHHALRLAVKHAALKGILEERCTGSFSAAMGIPCAHRQKQQRPLDINDFDKQWWLDQPIANTQTQAAPLTIEDTMDRVRLRIQNAPLRHQRLFQEHVEAFDFTTTAVIVEPSVIRPRGAPSAASRRLAAFSTRRNPSYFELVDAEVGVSQERRCGVCHQPGHNRRRCPKPLSTTELTAISLPASMQRITQA